MRRNLVEEACARFMAISESERERRRDLVRKMHDEVIDQETGRRKFGGPQPGSGRPRVTTATELAAEEAAKHKDAIVQVFKDAIDPNNHISARLKGATEWIALEHKQMERDERDEDRLRRAKREELIDVIAFRLARAVSVGAIDLDGMLRKAHPALEAAVLHEGAAG